MKTTLTLLVTCASLVLPFAAFGQSADPADVRYCDALAAKYAGLRGTALTPAQKSAWRRIEELAAPFHAADKLLFGIPLWNFGIPYKLKHLIDVISQKDVLFTFDGTGFAGKLTGKKAAVVYARGLDYASPGSFTPAREYDLQRPYVEMWLKFVGVTDVHGAALGAPFGERYGDQLSVE